MNISPDTKLLINVLYLKHRFAYINLYGSSHNIVCYDSEVLFDCW